MSHNVLRLLRITRIQRLHPGGGGGGGIRGAESDRGLFTSGGGRRCGSVGPGWGPELAGNGGGSGVAGGGGGLAIEPAFPVDGLAADASPRTAARWRCSNRTMLLPSLIKSPSPKATGPRICRPLTLV